MIIKSIDLGKPAWKIRGGKKRKKRNPVLLLLMEAFLWKIHAVHVSVRRGNMPVNLIWQKKQHSITRKWQNQIVREGQPNAFTALSIHRGKQIHTTVINPDSDAHWRFVVLIPLVSTSKSHSKVLKSSIGCLMEGAFAQIKPFWKAGIDCIYCFQGQHFKCYQVLFSGTVTQIWTPFSTQAFLLIPTNPKATQIMTKMRV